MGYALCTAEKPSVAKDIARVIGADKKENGYFIGNGYIVTWAVGHLVGLAEPEAYGYVPQKEMYADSASKEKAYGELPLLPDDFKLEVIESTKAQFEIIKQLMHRDDVDYIIDCGDMGAEGHILQWFIREKAGNVKPVKRFCATSMTDEAILHAMAHLRSADEFIPIIRGEFCKKKEDWILGMSLSRALSLKYDTPISVGRVQSPTLGFVVKRYVEIMRFKPVEYYTLESTVEGNTAFKVFWNKDTQKILTPHLKDGEDRVTNKVVVTSLCRDINAKGEGEVIDVAVEKKATNRPQLYDITELQREANRKYGYSASVTLATAQALYETHKVLSYPRTDSRYITSDLEPYMEKCIKQISSLEKYKSVAGKLLQDGLNIDKRIVDDSKVTDHHALITTSALDNFDFSKLHPTKDELKKGVTKETLVNILDLVITRLLVAFSKPYLYEKTKVTVRLGVLHFSADGNKPIELGWKGIQQQLENASVCEDNDEGEDTEQLFPKLEIGQKLKVVRCDINTKTTTPPKLHTEATLLSAMENAGQLLGEEYREILKGRGIGTQATRAEIIKKLFDAGYVEHEVKKKTPYIKPTMKGIMLIRLLPPDLYSPKITADWETKIAKVADGSLSEESLMAEFTDYIKQKTAQIKNEEFLFSFDKGREDYGECPWCGKPVYRSQKKNGKKVERTDFYCSDKCGWSLSTNNVTFQTRLGRSITEAEAKKFISQGYINLQCTSQSSGSKYNGTFLFYSRETDGKKYCNVKCELTKPKRKRKK